MRRRDLFRHCCSQDDSVECYGKNDRAQGHGDENSTLGQKIQPKVWIRVENGYGAARGGENSVVTGCQV